VVVPALPTGGELRAAAWSPWSDGDGRTRLVGLWCGRRGQGAVEQSLVQVSQPDGTVLDRLPVADLPSWLGAPCWSPDRPGRVLLAGGDGVLYRLDFNEPGVPPRPRPLTWNVDGGAIQVASLLDLSWPGGPRLGGRTVLASISPIGVRGTSHLHADCSIGWIRLDPDCSAATVAGLLIQREYRASVGEDERFPVVSPTTDAVPRLVWLERRRDRHRDPWRLRVAPVEFDPRSGAPSVRAELARNLAEDCAAAAPAFSADGRWISYISAPIGPGLPRLRRLALADAGGHAAADGAGPVGR
jgi:hypothetical protein